MVGVSERRVQSGCRRSTRWLVCGELCNGCHGLHEIGGNRVVSEACVFVPLVIGKYDATSVHV
jgi:hypothetical protein